MRMRAFFSRVILCVFPLVLILPVATIPATFQELQSDPLKFVGQASVLFTGGFVFGESRFQWGQIGNPTISTELCILLVLPEPEKPPGLRNSILVIFDKTNLPTEDLVWKVVDIEGTVQRVAYGDPNHEMLYWRLLNMKQFYGAVSDPLERPQIFYVLADKIQISK